MSEQNNLKCRVTIESWFCGHVSKCCASVEEDSAEHDGLASAIWEAVSHHQHGSDFAFDLLASALRICGDVMENADDRAVSPEARTLIDALKAYDKATGDTT